MPSILKIIGKKGSKSKLAIAKNTPIKLYSGQRKVDAIVNYGLAGKKLHVFLKKYPWANRNLPIINRNIGMSKYRAVKKCVEGAGILAPDTKISLARKDVPKDWIEKRVHSSQGNGIRAARGKREISGKYYQKMISDRRYELRVHAFKWLDPSEWTLNKRIGPADQIAWNFHQGGHFQSVKYPNKYDVFLEAKDISDKVLTKLNMAFGAVDLIVDNNMKIYFIEVNASPGFTEFNQGVYFRAFEKLSSLPKKTVMRLAR